MGLVLGILQQRYGAKIDRTYSAALNGYSVEVSEAQARKLAADPAVKSVVQNRIFTVDATQPNASGSYPSTELTNVR